MAQRLVLPAMAGALDRFVYRPRARALGWRVGPGGAEPLFRAVYFEVRTRCNGGCSFCAASVTHETRADEQMPEALYRKVVGELAALRYSGSVAFHVNNDPLLFPRLPEYVAHARERLPSAWIVILTNGKALTVARAERLVAAGIDEISINDYRDEEGSPFPERFLRIRDEVVPRIRPGVPILPGHGPEPGRLVFRFNLERRGETQILSSRAGTSPSKGRVSPDPWGFCEHPFTQLNIATDGRISKCCADVYFDDPMGDVGHESVLEIWRGGRFRRVREALLQGRRRDVPGCDGCDFCGVRPTSSLGRLTVLAARRWPTAPLGVENGPA